MYKDEAPSAWPSLFQTDYQPLIYLGWWIRKVTRYCSYWRNLSAIVSGHSVSLFNRPLRHFLLGIPLSIIGNRTPPTLLLPPFLDYIRSINCKILLACLATITLGLLLAMMEPFNPFTNFTFTWGFFNLIWRALLGYVPRFPGDVPPAISSSTVWRFTRRFFNS